MDKKWKTAAIACLCTVAVLSVSFSAVTLARLKKLESNLSQVQNSVTSIDSDINSTLNTAITTITQTAEKQASIVSDYKVVATTPRCGSGTAAIRSRERAMIWSLTLKALTSRVHRRLGWSRVCMKRTSPFRWWTA